MVGYAHKKAVIHQSAMSLNQRKNMLAHRDWANRAAVALIFVYFGVLKLLQASPAEELVMRLQTATLPFLSSGHFLMFLGAVETIVGGLFLFRRHTRLATVVFAAHMATTFLPFIFLPDITWLAPGIPTLTGQYIFKNVALIALVYTIFTDFHLHEEIEGRDAFSDAV